jgi:serine kinase of HPr protein (carbohydrate metabolism regulator)
MTPPPRVIVHGTSVVLGAAGRTFGAPAAVAVLLLGTSGSGKSDLALRLIHAGSRLIADDQTSLFERDGLLQASAPEGIRGLLEVRGVGIVPVEPVVQAPLVLVVQLRSGEIARMPEEERYQAPLPLRPKTAPLLFTLDPFEASAPAKIAAAAALAAQAMHIKGP